MRIFPSDIIFMLTMISIASTYNTLTRWLKRTGPRVACVKSVVPPPPPRHCWSRWPSWRHSNDGSWKLDYESTPCRRSPWMDQGPPGLCCQDVECFLDVLRWKEWQGQQFANKLFATNTHVCYYWQNNMLWTYQGKCKNNIVNEID